jgi:predicted nucleic acid-binding protein
MRSAHSRNAPIRIPAAVLVELYRGRGIDEAIDNVFARGFAQVVTTGARMARVAGHLLAGIGGGSDMAIDALVVATAIRFGGGIVATHDPHDLQRLADGHSNIAILEI